MMIDAFKETFPECPDRFLEIQAEETALFAAKNHDYTKGGAMTGNFTRVAAILAQYPDLSMGDPRSVAVVYMLKQLDSILWGISHGIRHRVEGIGERAKDLAVYAKLLQLIEDDLSTAGRTP